MSNKKNVKKSNQPKQKAQNCESKKKPTKIIIAAVAAVVVIAAVLIGIFVIKPAIEKNQGLSD